MRAIHLLGLRGADGARLRFYPDDDAPLVLPWWIPERDREVLLAFYQQVIADDLLVRVEVDWVDGIAPQDLAFLASERRRHGAEDRMVVVRVRREGVDLHDVLGLPEIRSFRRVAVVCEHMAEHETIGALLGLGSVATQAAEARYDQLAEELSLRKDARELLAPVLQRLQNPIDMVECFNTLIRAHGARVAAEDQLNHVIGEMLEHLLLELPRDEALVLLACGVSRYSGTSVSIGAPQRRLLRSRMLLRDDSLVGWAMWLGDIAFIDSLIRLWEQATAATVREQTVIVPLVRDVAEIITSVRKALEERQPIQPPP